MKNNDINAQIWNGFVLEESSNISPKVIWFSYPIEAENKNKKKQTKLTWK